MIQQNNDAKKTLIFKLTDAAREAILQCYPPRFSETIAHHITHQSNVPADTPLPPAPHSARVIGYACDEALEALVAEVDGTNVRPDGGTYHITLSLEPEQREAKDSNTLLRAGWQSREPLDIEVVPSSNPS